MRWPWSRRPKPQREPSLILSVSSEHGVRIRKPASRERVQQTVHGPRILGYCSECQGPMEQSVSGTSWHVGRSCHWHEQGTDCCRFIPLPGAS